MKLEEMRLGIQGGEIEMVRGKDRWLGERSELQRRRKRDGVVMGLLD